MAEDSLHNFIRHAKLKQVGCDTAPKAVPARPDQINPLHRPPHLSPSYVVQRLREDRAFAGGGGGAILIKYIAERFDDRDEAFAGARSWEANDDRATRFR
jgi:hypothetical protein